MRFLTQKLNDVDYIFEGHPLQKTKYWHYITLCNLIDTQMKEDDNHHYTAKSIKVEIPPMEYIFCMQGKSGGSTVLQTVSLEGPELWIKFSSVHENIHQMHNIYS